MNEKTVNWLTFTCLIGLIPLVLRLCVWFISNEHIEPISISDLVAFGLVLHASNINEVNNFGEEDSKWRNIHNSVSICFIAVYGLLLFTTIIPSLDINSYNLLVLAISLSFISFAISWTIFQRSRVVATSRNPARGEQ